MQYYKKYDVNNLKYKSEIFVLKYYIRSYVSILCNSPWSYECTFPSQDFNNYEASYSISL